MSEPIEDTARRQRLLEGWLPLAQEANQRYGWELDAPALEHLIISAAPGLGLARSSLEACAILWGVYTSTLSCRWRGLRGPQAPEDLPFLVRRGEAEPHQEGERSEGCNPSEPPRSGSHGK